MEKQTHTFHYTKPFQLESGRELPGFQLQYTTLGQLNADRSNIVWVCHALTGSSDFTTWWKELFEDASAFNPKQNLIICANMLGGCYGSTGPLSVNPETGNPFFHQFPQLTNRDVVRAFDLLREYLGFSKINTIIGGSLGGQQVLEWLIQQPQVFEHAVLVATNAVHSSWGIAFNEAQRLAIEADPSWKENNSYAGSNGLKAARAMAILSYRQYETFEQTQTEQDAEVTDHFRAATYQRYQGEKLVKRFNAFTYWLFSKMMDSHHVGRNRISIGHALKQIKAKTLVVGVESDGLFPISEQKLLAEKIPGAELVILSSVYGHDGFLTEHEQLNKVLKSFYKEENHQPKASLHSAYSSIYKYAVR
jgi:homoserine O-acetyltransferase